MNFIKDLKQEVKTLDQAKAKARGFAIITGISGLVISVALMFMSVALGLIILLGTVGVAGWLYFVELQKAKRNFCPECGAKYDYDHDISWEISEENIVDVKPNTDRAGKQICGKRKDTYHFECTCSSCGHEMDFYKTFETGVAYTDGSVKFENRATIAKNYFRL